MSKLRATTPEEQATHVTFLKGVTADENILKEGHKAGYISKSQMKKGLADAYN